MKKREEEVTFDILEHKGVIREKNGMGYTKEANVIAWNGGAPKLDIREWDDNHERMTRGITLSEEEAVKAVEILKETLPSEENWPDTPKIDKFSREISVNWLMHLGIICKRPASIGEPWIKEWIKEINIVSWNGGQPKVDIREWSPDHEQMSRGITLCREEAVRLSEIDPRFGELEL